MGSISHEILDKARCVHLAVTQPGRRLRLKIWYPALPDPDSIPERLWAEPREDPRLPWIARCLLGLVRQRTSTLAGARFATAGTQAGLVIYNHGFVSFASENTSLMEELASHGFLVVAVRHAAQLEELRGLQRDQPAANRPALRELEQGILRGDARRRSELARAYYEASTTTNRIVRERALDSSFVLDHLREVLAAVPGRRSDAGCPESAHLVGFSAGGAVSTQVAMNDPRALSVTNLDGGTQGPVDARALRVPYLMFYSARNEGINDLLLPDHARRVTAPGTAHLNFHDIAGLLPLLRFTGGLGRTNSRAFLHERNAVTREFISTHS